MYMWRVLMVVLSLVLWYSATRAAWTFKIDDTIKIKYIHLFLIIQPSLREKHYIWALHHNPREIRRVSTQTEAERPLARCSVPEQQRQRSSQTKCKWMNENASIRSALLCAAIQSGSRPLPRVEVRDRRTAVLHLFSGRNSGSVFTESENLRLSSDAFCNMWFQLSNVFQSTVYSCRVGKQFYLCLSTLQSFHRLLIYLSFFTIYGLIISRHSKNLSCGILKYFKKFFRYLERSRKKLWHSPKEVCK